METGIDNEKLFQLGKNDARKAVHESRCKDMMHVRLEMESAAYEQKPNACPV